MTSSTSWLERRMQRVGRSGPWESVCPPIETEIILHQDIESESLRQGVNRQKVAILAVLIASERIPRGDSARLVPAEPAAVLPARLAEPAGRGPRSAVAGERLPARRALRPPPPFGHVDVPAV